MVLSPKLLTILTLPNYFPLVFLFRVALSVVVLAMLIFVSHKLYKNENIDKVQHCSLVVLSTYVVLMLYYTVTGRYSQSYYRYNGEIFGSFYELISNFSMSDLSHIVTNLLMMIPVSFLLTIIIKGKFRALWALDLTALLILSIEILQFFTRTGTFQLDDILYNSFGAIVGIIAFYIVNAAYKWKRNEKL